MLAASTPRHAARAPHSATRGPWGSVRRGSRSSGCTVGGTGHGSDAMGRGPPDGQPGEPTQGVPILDSFRRGRRITGAALSTCSSDDRSPPNFRADRGVAPGFILITSTPSVRPGYPSRVVTVCGPFPALPRIRVAASNDVAVSSTDAGFSTAVNEPISRSAGTDSGGCRGRSVQLPKSAPRTQSLSASSNSVEN